MRFFIDYAYIKDGNMNLIGWSCPGDPAGHISYEIVDRSGKARDAKILVTTRPDLGYALFRDPERPDLGYFIQFPYAPGETVSLVMREVVDGEVKNVYKQHLSKSYIRYRMARKRVKQALLREIDFLKRVRKTLTGEDQKRYLKWFYANRADEAELAKERNTTFEKMPLISILTPVYHTPLQVFTDMIESALAQSYANFELILVRIENEDASLVSLIDSYAEKDSRVKVVVIPKNEGIAGNTNAAVKAASGEYMALLDHDDVIEPDALFTFVKAVNEDPEADIFYSDEDKITTGVDSFFAPNMKPDWNPVQLLSNNYICHLLMIRSKLVVEAGGLRSEYDGAQDHDLLLRLTEKTDRVKHVPRVLYHWRSSSSSAAKNVTVKEFAWDNGVKALNDHYKRLGIRATAKKGAVPGWYVTKYELTDRPLVSVIIPNKDHVKDLKKCLDSLFVRSTYKNVEVIVVENNSTDPETFAYYEKAKEAYPDLKVITYEGEFNYSSINNLGVSSSRGDYILLLNNDIEVETPDFLESMLSYVMQKNVGIVGAKLLYPDRSVQHAGVLVGFGGIAGHLFKGAKEDDPGYMCRAITTMNLSAVTGACLLVSRKIFDEVGGLDPAFRVSFNDVDFCLKVRKAGYQVIYDAEAVLIHAESKSRGIEDTPEKFLRFAGESRLLSSRWKVVGAGAERFVDPYYNPNLSYMELFKPDIGKF